MGRKPCDKYGLDGFEQWQRGGQDFQAKYDWASYRDGYADTESTIEASASSFTDDNRFNPNISYVGG